MAVIIFVFFGMLRYHVFHKLTLKSLVLVFKNGKEVKLAVYPPDLQKKLLFANGIIGFYFNDSDKYHPAARVYFPKLSDLNPFWQPIFPFRALKLLWIHGLFKHCPFNKKNLSEACLISAMQSIDKNKRDFKTHSLRIGAHTFFITHGLPEDFVSFLGRRKTVKVSQIYYRASPRLTILKLRDFAARSKIL